MAILLSQQVSIVLLGKQEVYIDLPSNSYGVRPNATLGIELLELAQSIGRTPCQAILTCF